MSSKNPNPSFLPSNSRNTNEDVAEKSVSKVVSGPVQIKKKPLNKRVGEAFLGDDASTVKSYLIWEVLIPAAKDTIAELVKKGIDAILYGKANPPSNLRRENGTSYVSYNSYSRGGIHGRSDPPWRTDYKATGHAQYNKRAAHDFSDIEMTKEDAENVLSRLVDVTMQYGEVSVADFYELVGMVSSYVDNKYGWGDLSEARVVRTRNGGYILKLPTPELLDI